MSGLVLPTEGTEQRRLQSTKGHIWIVGPHHQKIGEVIEVCTEQAVKGICGHRGESRVERIA